MCRVSAGQCAWKSESVITQFGPTIVSLPMEMVHERAVIAVPLSWTPSARSMRAVGA